MSPFFFPRARHVERMVQSPSAESPLRHQQGGEDCALAWHATVLELRWVRVLGGQGRGLPLTPVRVPGPSWPPLGEDLGITGATVSESGGASALPSAAPDGPPRLQAACSFLGPHPYKCSVTHAEVSSLGTISWRNIWFGNSQLPPAPSKKKSGFNTPGWVFESDPLPASTRRRTPQPHHLQWPEPSRQVRSWLASEQVAHWVRAANVCLWRVGWGWGAGGAPIPRRIPLPVSSLVQ